MKTDEYFRSLIQNCSDIISVINVDGRIEYISPSAKTVLGYDPEWMIGKEFSSFVHPKDLEAVEKSFDIALQEHKTVKIKRFLALHHNGNWRTLEGKGIGIVDESGKIQFIANARDVTEQLEAYQALAEREKQYRLLTETSRDIIILIDNKGIIKFVNQYAASKFEKTPEMMIGMDMRSLFPPDRSADQIRRVEKVFENGEAVNIESEVEFPTGKSWQDTWLIPILDENGVVAQVFGVSRNITSKKEAEKQLEQRTQQAEEAKLEAQEYFDYLAHDVANLVAPILNYAEAMTQKEDISPEMKKYALRIIDQVKEIATFLLNLRTLTEVQKISAASVESIDLSECLNGIIRAIYDHYPNRKFRLHYEKPPYDKVRAVGGKYIRDMLTVELDRAARYAHNQDIDVYMKIVPASDEYGSEFWQIRLDVPNIILPNKFREMLSTRFDLPEKRSVRRRGSRNLSFLATVVEHFGGKLWFEELTTGYP